MRAARWASLLAVFTAIAFAVYAPALGGPPISDDFALFLNPWVQQPTWAHALALVDPWSEATLSLINYAPVRPLLQSLLWWLSPQSSVVYHSVNVALHAAASALLVAFLARLGFPFLVSALAGLCFLVHPANVEAVAWMAQVWSPLALLFSLVALLWLPRRPGLATVAFALALLTKPMAVFALPTAVALAWTGAEAPPGRAPREERFAWPARWRWLALWALLCALFAIVQIGVFTDSGQDPGRTFGALERARLMGSIALRYLVMAATSLGVSIAQEPTRPVAWTDPWFLVSVPIVAALGARTALVLRARRLEAVGWVFALAAFAPVSQLFPFLHPLADRYLYFILPGLLVAALAAGRERLHRDRRVRLVRAAAVAALALCSAFALRSHDRAYLWRSETAQLAEAARNFPDGIAAHLLRARKHGAAGDAGGEIAALTTAEERGFVLHGTGLAHPSFRRVRNDPRYAAYRDAMASRTLARIASKPRLTQLDLRDAALLHELRGEREAAVAAVDRALALGGPLEPLLQADRERLLAEPQGVVPDADR